MGISDSVPLALSVITLAVDDHWALLQVLIFNVLHIARLSIFIWTRMDCSWYSPAAWGKVCDEYHDAQVFYVVMIISGVCIGLTYSVHLHIASSAPIIELRLWHAKDKLSSILVTKKNGQGWGINFVFGWLSRI